MGISFCVILLYNKYSGTRSPQSVRGTGRDVVTLCSEWTKDIRIWCQATGEHPVLESIRVEDYVPVIGQNSGGKKEQTGNGEK